MKERFKDWRTTAPAIATAVALWIVFDPELFATVPVIGKFLVSGSKFAAVGGFAVFGINATSSVNKQKGPEEKQ